MKIKERIIKLIYRNPVKYARKIGVKVGNECRFSGHPDFGVEPYLCEIGNHVLLAGGVLFLTHDSGNWVFREQTRYEKTMKFGRVKISDNVYIGARVILMPGVTVGQNCIIGAGSIVTKDIPDNSLAVGSPARVIKTTSEYAEKLLAQMPEYNMQLLKEDRRKGIEEFIHLYNEKNKGIDHDKE